MKNGTFEDSDGNIEWWFNGNLHREYGPAVVWANGDKAWYIHGKRHREYGPAIEYMTAPNKWYINDNELTEKQFNQWLENKNLNTKLETNLHTKSVLKRSKI